jgi:hypothetical protein
MIAKNRQAGSGMQIVYHLGAHCTDEERLLRCLLRNRSTLAEQGIEIPGPTRYRNLLVDMARKLRGSPATRDTQAMVLDQIIETDEPTRIVLGWDSFMGFAQSALGEHLYPGGARRMAGFRSILPDLPHEFFLALRNPATFVPAIIEKIVPRGKPPPDVPDPMQLRWSELVLSLRAMVPDAAITVWCDEDTPLLWTTVLQAVSGHADETVLQDTDDLLERLMGPAGLQRMNAYLASHPPADAAHRSRVVSAFLDKFAAPEAVETEIEVAGWTEGLVAELTDAYDRDVARLMQMDGVRVLVP